MMPCMIQHTHHGQATYHIMADTLTCSNTQLSVARMYVCHRKFRGVQTVERRKLCCGGVPSCTRAAIKIAITMYVYTGSASSCLRGSLWFKAELENYEDCCDNWVRLMKSYTDSEQEEGYEFVLIRQRSTLLTTKIIRLHSTNG